MSKATLRKTGSPRNSLFAFSLLLLAGVAAAPAHAANADAYSLLADKAHRIEAKNQVDGWAYVISGGLAVAISVPGYFLSEDLFAKVIYISGQTFGTIAIGYGAYELMVEDDYTRFLRILHASRTLSPAERNDLAGAFIREGAERARAARKIRIITHSIAGGLNLVNGFGARNSDLRTALFFLAGVNALAAVNYAVKESDEEKMAQSLSLIQRAELTIGPTVALTWRF